MLKVLGISRTSILWGPGPGGEGNIYGPIGGPAPPAIDAIQFHMSRNRGANGDQLEFPCDRFKFYVALGV